MLQRWLSFWKVLPSPQRKSGALSEWPSGLDHLPDQGPSPLIAQFGQAASPGKNIFGSKTIPFKNDGGHCVLGDPQYCRSVPRHNPVSELYRQFLRPHGLVFALTCTVNCWALYRQVCAFPNYVQSIEFTTGELQSSWRNIKDGQWKQDAPELNFESHSKGSEKVYK